MPIYLFLLLVVLCWITIYHLGHRDNQSILEYKITTAEFNQPLVSIIIPARNEEDTLPTSLTSLTKLDYPNYEIIVIDDHSVDQTYSIAKSFTNDHSNFKVIRSKDLPPGWTGKNWANYQGAKRDGLR
jgi:cellulose synthase/poly-beta-1,6-N-acetylglucosamine synthase-like glycosyltransferase